LQRLDGFRGEIIAESRSDDQVQIGAGGWDDLIADVRLCDLVDPGLYRPAFLGKLHGYRIIPTAVASRMALFAVDELPGLEIHLQDHAPHAAPYCWLHVRSATGPRPRSIIPDALEAPEASQVVGQNPGPGEPL
jgi:hypothetical protein